MYAPGKKEIGLYVIGLTTIADANAFKIIIVEEADHETHINAYIDIQLHNLMKPKNNFN